MHFLYVLNESSVQVRKSESAYLGQLKNKYVGDIIHHNVPKTKTSERRSTDADTGPITSVLEYHFFLTCV